MIFRKDLCLWCSQTCIDQSYNYTPKKCVSVPISCGKYEDLDVNVFCKAEVRH